MKTATLNLITEIVDTRYGFILDTDMPALLADASLLHCDVLLRFDAGRKVVKLYEVQAEIVAVEMQGNHLRDVAFTATECDRLRQYS